MGRSFTTAPPPPTPSADATPPPTGIVNLTSLSEYDTLLAHSARHPLILDCYADWCGPCRKLTPLLEAAVAKGVSASPSAHPVLVKVDVDQQQFAPLASKLGVSAIPAVFIFHDGQLIGQQTGLLSGDQCDAIVSELIRRSGDGTRPTSASSGNSQS